MAGSKGERLLDSSWAGGTRIRAVAPCAAIAGAVLCLAGCATSGETSALDLDLTRIAGSPAPARARLYADCIAQAAASGTFDRLSDPDTELIRFTCSGAPARAFYTALEARAAAEGSQWSAGGRTWRATNRIRRNLFGVDVCSTDGVADWRCDVTLNAGRFLVD